MGHPPRISNEDYREAVATIIRRVQKNHGLNDSQLAARLLCSPGTIKNARSRASNLDATILMSIERHFGPGAIDPYLALGGSRAVPIAASICGDHPTLAIVDALHRLIETQTPESEGGDRSTPRELMNILKELQLARSTFDALILIADPPPASAELRFSEKKRRRLAIVHTEGGHPVHTTVVDSVNDGAPIA